MADTTLATWPGYWWTIWRVMQLVSPLYKYGKIYMNDFYGIVCLNATTGNQTWYTYLSRENLAQGLAYSYNRIYTVKRNWRNLRSRLTDRTEDLLL